MTIDCHTHFMPLAMLKEIGEHGAKFGMEVKDLDGDEPKLLMSGIPHPSLKPFIDVESHLARMNSVGVNTHVVWQSSRPNIFWADASLGLSLAQIINDEYANLEERYAGRFIGIASVPLQDIPKAVEETQRAVVKKGLRGVMANTNINGRYLDDPYFWPFFEALQALDVPLFLHPAHPYGGDRLKEFHLSFLMGLPADTTLCIARLIFSGVLDRFPKLRLMVPHGGGMLPFIKGRFDHGYSVRSECRNIQREPSAYFDRMLFDTVVYDADVLAPALNCAKFALGSDYPYDMGDPRPRQTVTDAVSHDSRLLTDIFSENLNAFLGPVRR